MGGGFLNVTLSASRRLHFAARRLLAGADIFHDTGGEEQTSRSQLSINGTDRRMDTILLHRLCSVYSVTKLW